MSLIRVGIIGLGSKISEGYAPGEWGISHLRALQASPNYEVVAVCNSSVESATKSIEFHGLDRSVVKPYGSPQDLAADSNVDMAIISVSVGKHMALAKPVIKAGKDILVEYPLAPTIGEVEELARLVKAKGIRAMAGTQASSDPAIAKLRELVKTKAVGDVVSTVFVGTSPVDVSQGWLEATSTFLDIDGGANRIHITAGHLMGAFVGVLGGFKNVQSIYKTKTKTTTLLDGAYKPVRTDYPVTAPDTMSIQGVLNSGALATVNLRVATTPVDDTGFRWIISGTQGEIEFTAKPGFVQSPAGSKIVMRKWGSEPEEVTPQTEGEDAAGAKLLGIGSLVRAYDAFAKNEEGEFSTLESAVEVHRILDQATRGAVWAP